MPGSLVKLRCLLQSGTLVQLEHSTKPYAERNSRQAEDDTGCAAPGTPQPTTLPVSLWQCPTALRSWPQATIGPPRD